MFIAASAVNRGIACQALLALRFTLHLTLLVRPHHSHKTDWLTQSLKTVIRGRRLAVLSQGVASLPLSVAILGDWEVPQRPLQRQPLSPLAPALLPYFSGSFLLFAPITLSSCRENATNRSEEEAGGSAMTDWAASYSSTANRHLPASKIPTRNVTQPASTGAWHRENVKSLPAGPGGSLSQ